MRSYSKQIDSDQETWKQTTHTGNKCDKNVQINNQDRDTKKCFFSQPVISLWKLQKVKGKNIMRFQKGLEMYIDVINYNSGYIS